VSQGKRITPKQLTELAAKLTAETGLPVFSLHFGAGILAEQGGTPSEFERIASERGWILRRVPELFGSSKPQGVVVLVFFDEWDSLKCFELSPEDSAELEATDYQASTRADRSFGEMFKHWLQ